MNDSLPHIDLTRVDEDNAREVLRLSEVYLDSLTRLAISSDARAVTLSTMLATLVTATAAIGAAIIAFPGDHSKSMISISVASLILGVCFFMALIQAGKAAEPVPFPVPGNYISSFTEAELYGDPKDLLIEQAYSCERRIHPALSQLHANACSLRKALVWMKFAPLLAIIAGATALAFNSSPGLPPGG
jgi:hypothetical protein